MDKNEYRAKLDEINDLVDRQDYKGALKIVDTIDWRRVRSARTLCMVGEIYEANKRYEDSRKLLLMAHHRAPIGRTVIYRLVELSIKMGNFDEAADYYKQFVEISPNDNSRYILKYKLARAKRAPLEEQISILKEYKSREYTERWAYELARLYAKAGKKEACIEECDDLILWFSEGKYVTKAMELKMKYTPLTPIQQDKYDHRFQKGYTPAAATKAVAAAAQAAEEVVKASVPSAGDQDKEIDAIIKSVVGEGAAGSGTQAPKETVVPQVSDTQELKDKAAQEILDVLPGRSVGEEETAAAREPVKEKEYVVKDLEPESFGKPSEPKPFHMGGVMKCPSKIQAPQSKLFKEEDMNPDDFKTDLKEKELDLEALLAETASELAQAVAEETESPQPPSQVKTEAQEEEVQEVREPESQEEQIQEEEIHKPQAQEISESEQEPETESPEENTGDETIAQDEIPAPAAAKSAMVADAIASALMEKAEEFEKDAKEALGDTREIVTEEILDTESGVPVVEAVEEAEFEEENVQEPQEETVEEVSETAEVQEAEEVPEETDAETEEVQEPASEPEEVPEEMQEPAPETENVPEEIQEPVPATEEIEESVAETIEEPTQGMEGTEAAEVSEEEPVPETEETSETEEEIPAETEEAQTDLQETKVIPDDQVREALGEIDLSSALEQELETTVLPKEQGEQDEAEVPGEEIEETEETEETAVPVSQPSAFGTAVEGLMRHHLTEEEHRRLFTYFAPVPGMSQQINEALDTAQESACARTSQAGNIIVTGREGSGKTKLSEGLIKALCKERQMQGAKVAYIEAEELNKKDPAAVVDKLSGGFLVIEHAGALDGDIVENLSKAMEFKTNRLTVILEDLKPGIRDLEGKYPEFMKKFDSRIVIPVFTNDELVSFAKTYAKELGYKIDDMAVLALYTLIGDNQNEENPVSIGMVREMMDEALKKAAKKGRRPGKRVSKRHLDESGRIMLYEKDFDI